MNDNNKNDDAERQWPEEVPEFHPEFYRLEKENEWGESVDGPVEWRAPNLAQATVALVIALMAAAFGMYKVLHDVDLQQSAALYIGIPALLAIGLTLSPRTRNPYTMAVKGITIALLLSIPIAGEGMICVLMAAPLFYLVALGVTFTIFSIKKSMKKGRMEFPALLALPILLMATEGVTPATTLDNTETASAHLTVSATAAQVDAALAQSLKFDADALPAYLQLGFPKPVGADSTGNDIGDRRTIVFEGATERPTAESQHHWGTEPTVMVLEVVEHSEGHLAFKVVSNNTPTASWVQIDKVNVDWSQRADGQTDVTWSMDYTRLLSPKWYFGPWEQYAIGKASEYLLHSTPFEAQP